MKLRDLSQFSAALYINLIVLIMPLSATSLDDFDCNALEVCEAAIELFKAQPDAVWPGYNLATQPFIVYRPGQWTLLFNYPSLVKGFQEYPSGWPRIAEHIQYRPDQYLHLAGQLAFSVPVDTIEVVAVPFVEDNTKPWDKPRLRMLEFLIHEAFHQFQRSSFGEIGYFREEYYPILNQDNTAFVALEMKILMAALELAYNDKMRLARNEIDRFVAVRNHRWDHSPDFVADYEQAKELNEGTAKYVEIKSLSLLKDLKYSSVVQGSGMHLQHELQEVTLHQWILNDFNNKLTDESVKPDDVARNRIYPVGAAQGLLLDRLGIEWKPVIQIAGDKVTMAGMLQQKQYNRRKLNKLVRQAQKRFNFDLIVSSTEQLCNQYQEDFNAELAMFNAQPGYRIEVDFLNKNISRSRSSSVRRWTANQGRTVLCNYFNIYSLKGKSFLLQHKNIGVLEENDFDTRMKTVIFYSSSIAEFVLDDGAIIPSETPILFNKIQMNRNELTFVFEGEGEITRVGDTIHIPPKTPRIVCLPELHPLSVPPTPLSYY